MVMNQHQKPENTAQQDTKLVDQNTSTGSPQIYRLDSNNQVPENGSLIALIGYDGEDQGCDQVPGWWW